MAAAPSSSKLVPGDGGRGTATALSLWAQGEWGGSWVPSSSLSKSREQCFSPVSPVSHTRAHLLL